MDNFSIDREFGRYLDSGETILWRGQPKQGVRLQASDALMIPFSIMWGGFAIYWEVMAFNSGAPFFFRLWGVPFVLIGLYMMVGRFYGDAVIRKKTLYAVTSKRALIISGFFSRSLKSAELKTLATVEFSERSDRSGTIIFGHSQIPNFLLNSGMPMSGKQLPPMFVGIDDAKSVYDKVRDAQKKLKA